MRAYLATFGLVICAMLLVAGILFALGSGIIVGETFWAATATAKKTALARRIAEPRILIVSGSSGHFGLRADMIEAATRRPAVNLATHAGFGPAYFFYLAERVLRRGDIVILPLEYDFYLGSAPSLNELNVSVSYSRGLDYFQALGLVNEVRYVRELSPHQVWHGAMIRLGLEAALRRAPDGYQPDSIDRWGDETEETTSAVQAEGILDLERRICRAPLYPAASGIADLRGFIDWSKANGIEVLATWPNILADKCEAEAPFKATEADIRALYRELGVSVIGTPQQATLPVELLRDSVYHPTVRGAAIRTARFVKELCAETKLCAEGGTARAPAPPGAR
jgi:hypothetical protein